MNKGEQLKLKLFSVLLHSTWGNNIFANVSEIKTEI